MEGGNRKTEARSRMLEVIIDVCGGKGQMHPRLSS
jgi:hypothetical protein